MYPDRRFVLDTNILVDYAFQRQKREASSRLLRPVIHREVTLIETAETIGEFHRACRLFSRSSDPVNLRVLQPVLECATMIDLPYPSDQLSPFSHLGILDAMFLTLFLETDADALVTRDRRLRWTGRKLPEPCSDRVVSPEECLAIPWVHCLLSRLMDEPDNGVSCANGSPLGCGRGGRGSEPGARTRRLGR